MGVESATYISQLVDSNPLVGDAVGEGDDHLKLIKAVLQNQFPNLTAGAVNTTQTEMNLLDGVTALVALASDQSWTGSQRATLVTDNDGSFDLDLGQNFKCTPAAGLTLTFTNFADGQSGYIILVNSGGHAIARHGDTIADANFVSTVSAAGTYIISYISDGTDAFLTNSAIMA